MFHCSIFLFQLPKLKKEVDLVAILCYIYDLYLFWVFIVPSFFVFDRWSASSCSMDSLYDIDLISKTVPVILDNSKTWYEILSTSMKLGDRGMANVQGVSRLDLKDNGKYLNLLLINRTASPLSW